jgi:hypothetical protein
VSRAVDRSGLPSFIVIGAVKAATTWIAHQLRQHPAIYMPGPEPHYFSTAYDQGLDWYRSCFADAAPGEIIGEKSADYLAYSLAPKRIARSLPDIPLIVQLRNPVERAYSDYCMLFRRGTVTEDPRHYLERATAEQPRFLEDGLYGRHLARYLDHFDRSQIKIILHDDIRTKPAEIIAEVCRHVGIAVHVAPNEVYARKNDSEAATLPLPMRRLLRPVKRIVQPLRDRPWFRRLHAGLAQPVRYPPLTEDLVCRLRSYYQEDVEHLGAIVGRDLTPWLGAAQVAEAG